jgi:hypothetical protein
VHFYKQAHCDVSKTARQRDINQYRREREIFITRREINTNTVTENKVFTYVVEPS